MRFLTEDRAQAIQVGAVLLFAILIVFLSLYQAFVVPNQNEGIEFNHNQELQEQMTELRSTVVSMPEVTTTRSVSIDLGVRYPSRAIFTNPGPASGSLETVETTNTSHEIRIEGASATGTEPLGVGDFWNGTEHTYNTGALVYRPGYNLYASAPQTVYEHSALFNHFEQNQRTLSVTGHALVDDDRITLIALNGSMSESRVDRTAVDVRPVSTDTRVVALEPEGEEMTIELPTTVGEEGWNESLADLEDHEKIADVEISSEAVTLEIDGEIQLQLAKVGVGTGVTGTEPAYITGVTGDGATIDEGDTHEFTVEVRDKYNNPKRGVTVNASVEEGDLEETKKNTRANGQATFRYDSSGVVSAGEELTDTVDFSITEGYVIDETHDATSPANITMAVTVKKEEERGPGGTLYDVLWDQAAIDSHPGVDCDDGDCTYDARNATSNYLRLDMYTSNPAVSGASVDYSLGSGQDGVLDPWEGITDEEGENSTTFHPNGDGDFDTYVTSGNDGDELRIDVSGLPPRANDLFLHLDAYTIDQDNETGVTEWQDRTVNEFDATVGEGSEPTYIEDTNAAELIGPTVNFNNNNDEFLETDWQPSEDDGLDEGAAISTVVRVENPDVNPGIVGAGGDDPLFYQAIFENEVESGAGDSFEIGGNSEHNEFVIFTLQFDGDTATAFVNGEQQHEYDADFSGTSDETFDIGRVIEFAGFLEPLDGNIAEVLVYNEDITNNREDIESYLEEKWFEDVEDPEQDGIELEIDGERDTVTIEEGETVDYQIFETFDDGTEDEVTEEFEGSVFSESPEDVSVDEDANTVTGEQPADDVTVTADDGEFTDTVDVTVQEETVTQPTLNADDSNIDPNEVTEGDENNYVATVELEDLEDVTDGDVTVTLVNYEDGTDTDVEETVEGADLSGDTASVEVEFTDVEAPTADNSPYDVDASVDNFDADVDPIPQTQIDIITVEEDAAEPEFDSLEAEVTDTGGQGQINDIRLDYQLNPNEEETIEFRVYNDEERDDLIDTISRQSSGEEFTWDVDREGPDSVPVYIEADIDGGQCLIAELSSEGDTAELASGQEIGESDWEVC